MVFCTNCKWYRDGRRFLLTIGIFDFCYAPTNLKRNYRGELIPVQQPDKKNAGLDCQDFIRKTSFCRRRNLSELWAWIKLPLAVIFGLIVTFTIIYCVTIHF